MKIELTETEERHLRRLIAKELSLYKNKQSVVSEIRVFEMVKSFIERRQQINKLSIHHVSNLLIAWEQYKKANWWDSEAVDVEKVLMDRFIAFNVC